MARQSIYKTIIVIGCACILLGSTACSNLSVHRMHRHSDPLAGYKERPLGRISYDERHEESAHHVHLYKIHKGYALKARLDRDEDDSTDIVISKDKEKKWFAGMQWKWVF